jgi:hypothetical protein
MSTAADLVPAIEHLREMIRGDGADLRVVHIDDQARTIELALDLDDANCAECVLPPGRLHDVLAASLAQQGVISHRLVLHDPRLDETPAGEGARIVVLDPTAEARVSNRDPGPDAGPLSGKVVAFRVDVLWQSWDWVVDEWTSAFDAAGVTVRCFRRVQGLAGPDGAAADKAYATLLASVDAAIVGLGNCGSCTSWTIKDAVQAAETGLPTVAVVTEQFTGLAGTLAAHYGRPGLRTHVLPFPLQTRPEQEVRAIARDAFPNVLLRLGASV